MLVAALGTGAWLLGSESGARFVAPRAAPLVEGLELEGVTGTIAGGLRVQRLRFANDTLEVEATDVQVTLSLGSLVLGPPIRVNELAAGALTLRLRPGDPDAPAGDSGPVNLPAVAIEQLTLSAVRIEPVDAEPLLLDRLVGVVGLSGPMISISGLHAEGPRGKASGQVVVDLSRKVPLGATALDLDIIESPERRWRGRVTATPEDRGLSAQVALESPLGATLQFQHDGEESFAVDLDLPRQAGVAVGLDSEIEAKLRVSSDGTGYRLGGEFEAAGERVVIADARITRAEDRATIETLDLDWLGRGVVAIEGVIPLAATAEWELAIQTSGLLLPRGDGGTLTATGRTDVSGPRSEPLLAPALALLTEDFPPGALSGTVAWRGGVAVAEGLALALGRGKATIDGPIGAADPHVLRIRLTDFDPGLLAADWPGRLGGELRFEGRRAEQGFEGQVLLEELAGELRGRSIVGNGAVVLTAGRPGDGSLLVDVGRARLRVAFADAGRIEASLSAPDIGDLWPDVGGNVEATWKRDGVDRFDLRAETLRLGAASIATLTAGGTLGADADARIALAIDAGGVTLDGRSFESVRLAMDGSRNRHVITVNTRGAVTAALRIEGGPVDSGWSGRLASLDLDGIARLESPAELAWDGQMLRLGTACLGGAIGRSCVEATGGATGGQMSALLDRLDLAEVQRLAGRASDASVDGRVSGRAELAWRDGRPTSAELVLRSDRGRIELADREDVDLGWDDFALEATLADGAGGTVRGTMRLVPDGEITVDGDFTLDGADGLAYELGVDLAVRQLDAIEAFTTAIAEPEGDLSGQFQLRGGLSGTPAVSGAVALTGFTAQMPDQAIRIRDGVLVVAGVPDRLVVRGSARSGDGVITIDGRIDVNDPVPAEFVLAGEDFRVANSPTMMILVSPELTLAKKERRWNLDGRLAIPQARIDLERIEGGVAASPDVVVIDDPVLPAPARPWRARIEVALGDDVRLAGFGFDGRLAGRLDVRQRQGGRATGTGQLDVTGDYSAFGQRLRIREGYLRFAASPLDEPTIDLRAERKVRGQTVALSVTGSATAPTARVIPADGMSEQDALAMLVTGRPLNRTGSGDRDALSGAASALGVVGGDLLAGKLRGSLGLDELGVSNDTALDGEAFTIGKYLSPRLFVGYGIGLMTRGEVFTARFLLTDRLDVEASSGETQRAALNFRIER
jgi:translocation and assembly module TamB